MCTIKHYSYSVEKSVSRHQPYRVRLQCSTVLLQTILRNLQNNSLPTPSPTIRDQTDRNQTVCIPLAQTWLRQADISQNARGRIGQAEWRDSDRGTDLPEIWHDLSGICLGAVTGGNSWPAVTGVRVDWRGFRSNQLTWLRHRICTCLPTDSETRLWIEQ